MLAYLFLVFAIAFRFMVFYGPHPANFNFTPVAAALLFFGSRIPRKWTFVPVVLFAGSDVLLNRLYGYPLGVDLLITWAWYAAIVLLGSVLIGNKASVLRVGGSSLLASISFFVVSNFAVWAVWHNYPMTLAGLGECYAMGVPFFRNTVAGDLIFCAAFFGTAALIEMFSRHTAKNSLSA